MTFAPDFVPNDPTFPRQWWLQPKTGLDMLPVWRDYAGDGIKIGIVSTGFTYGNPSFRGRVDTELDWNAIDDTPDGNGYLTHMGEDMAMAVGAGINDGIAGVGAAPRSTLVSFKLAPRFGETPESVVRTPAMEAELLQMQTKVDVSLLAFSYSGAYFRDNFMLRDFQPAAQAIAVNAAQGRDGLGTIMVTFGGELRRDNDSVDYHNYMSNKHTIVSAPVTTAGVYNENSAPGYSLLVSVPSGSPYNASAMVAGVAALMLEANPDLGWRDVQDIMAAAAKPTDTTNPTWFTNKATGWNGGGQMFSRDYGFGVLDAQAAIRLAETWTDVSTSANELNLGGTVAINQQVPDGRQTGITSKVTIGQPIRVDRAEVTINLPHARAGDLVVTLVSPSGTIVPLYNRLDNAGFAGANSLRFTASLNAFRGEQGQGDWTLIVRDARTGEVGTFENWALNITGDAPSGGQRHIYTDSYATLGTDAARQVLTASGGIDTLDAAAVRGAVTIDLRPGATSTIAGNPVTVALGGIVQNANGGDGNDTITGNDGANVINAGRGNDIVNAGEGDDTIVARAGSDTIDGGGGRDTVVVGGNRAAFTVTSNSDGTVTVAPVSAPTIGTMNTGTLTLRNVETLRFSDQAVSLGDPGAPPKDADVLILRSANGMMLSWDANRGSDGFTFTGQFDPQQVKVLSHGDFNGDGREDYLLQSGNAIVGWNPSKGAQGFTALPDPAGSAAVASGPLQLGGADRVILENKAEGRIQALDPLTGARTTLLTGQQGQSVVSSGDIDGNGTLDLIFRQDATGALSAWTGGSATQGLLTPAEGWSVAAAGNFVGDAADDLLLRNDATGTLIFWDVKRQGDGFADFLTLPDGWKVGGTGDVNGDGRDDVILQRSADGVAIYWDGQGFQDLGDVLSAVTLVGLGAG